MKTYRVIQTEDAAKAIHDRVHYIIDRYSNDQAATAVWEDYKNTRDLLATTAGSIAEPESRALQERGLKRINFSSHDYFILFRIENDVVYIVSVFHFLEDFEKKIK